MYVMLCCSVIHPLQIEELSVITPVQKLWVHLPNIDNAPQEGAVRKLLLELDLRAREYCIVPTNVFTKLSSKSSNQDRLANGSDGDSTHFSQTHRQDVIAEVTKPQVDSSTFLERLRSSPWRVDSKAANDESALMSPRILVLDGVRDPGNVGSLIRSAFVLGWDGAVLLNGCCDPFNLRALRAGRGTTFHLPIAEMHTTELPVLAEQLRIPVCVADGNTGVDVVEWLKNRPVTEEEEGCMLVLGNESEGVSDTLVQACEEHDKSPQRFSVRTSEGARSAMGGSLNVSQAGAILMHHLRSTPGPIA